MEFTPSGYIIYANELLLKPLGYELDEIINKHHSMLCFPEDVEKNEYHELWKTLANGTPTSSRFIRRDKKGTLFGSLLLTSQLSIMGKWNMWLRLRLMSLKSKWS
ncbi:PAS domain-containing protein [Vibrio metschnikovii]